MAGRLRAGRPGSPGTRAQCGGPASCTVPSLTERPARASPAGVDPAPAGPALRAGGQILNQGASLDSRADWQVEFGVGGYTWSRRRHYGHAPDWEVLARGNQCGGERTPEGLAGLEPSVGEQAGPQEGSQRVAADSVRCVGQTWLRGGGSTAVGPSLEVEVPGLEMGSQLGGPLLGVGGP